MAGYSLKDAIRIAVLTKDGKAWPTYDGKMLDRRSYITASEATKCIRQLAFDKIMPVNNEDAADFWHNMPEDEFQARLSALRDDDKLGIFERGNVIEDWIVQSLLSVAGAHEEYMFVGADQRSFYTEHLVSGTPDGIYIDHDLKTFRVLEFKSTQNPVSSAKYAHIKQLQLNMGIIDRLIKGGKLDSAVDFPFTTYKMVGGNLLYVSSDNYLTMNEFTIEYDGGEAYVEAAATAKRLFKRGKPADPATLEPEGLRSNYGCVFCPWKEKCRDIEDQKENSETSVKLRDIINRVAGKTGLPEMGDLSLIDTKGAAAVASNFFHLKMVEKDAADKQKALKPALEEIVKKAGVSKVTFSYNGADYSINLSDVTRKGSIDEAKLATILHELGISEKDIRKPDTAFKQLRVTVTPDDAYLYNDVWEAFTVSKE